jgi:hypothetical protein
MEMTSEDVMKISRRMQYFVKVVIEFRRRVNFFELRNYYAMLRLSP